MFFYLIFWLLFNNLLSQGIKNEYFDIILFKKYGSTAVHGKKVSGNEYLQKFSCIHVHYEITAFFINV